MKSQSGKFIFAISALAFVFFSLPAASFSADNRAIHPWGMLAPLEMGRDYLADDPTASAAVVFDKGDIVVGPGFDFSLERRCRIQIFTPAGYRYATTKIPFHRNEQISNLEAHTITPDGRVVPVPDNRIYEINNGSWRAIVFAFPEVTPGSIVEYKYQLKSRDFYYLRPWVFQTDIPTEQSELKVHLPPGFEYAAVVSGIVEDNSPETDWYYSPEHNNTKIRTFLWRARDLPALQPVDYLTSLEDYRARLDFQIISYRNQQTDRKFIDSWPDLIQRVREWYGRLLRLSPAAKLRVGELLGGPGLREEVARRIYSFCRDSIALAVDPQSVSAEDLQPVEQVLAERRGNAVEKNLLLISLLRNAGLPADPVLISTRDHLHFDPRDHRLDQFNHVIARVQSPTEPVFLDASDPAAWFGLLPPNSWVDAGVWVAPDDGAIIDLPSPEYDHTTELNAEIQLESDGQATCRLSGTLAGYRAWEWARNATPADFEEFIKSTWIAPGAVIRLTEITTPERVKNGTVTFSLEFVWENAARVGLAGLYFRPTGFLGLPENPFTDKQRAYPVSFAFPYLDITRIVWHLPEGFTVAEVPRGGALHTQFLDYACGFSQTDRSVTVERRISISRRDFPLHSYPELRNFFENVVRMDRDLAVGARNAAASADPATGSIP